MSAELQLKKVPEQIKSLISREADLHRRSINQEAIVLLEEALLARARTSRHSKDDIEAILKRYEELPTLDSRLYEGLIEYDENGLPI